MITKLRSTVSKAGATFLMLSLVAACSSPDAEIKPKAEVKTTPVVIVNAPLTGAKDISLKPSISASFSEAMDNATINETTFTLTAGSTAVKGSVRYSGATAVFVPAAPLANETKFTATIFPGAKSAAGVALTAAHSWTFSTIAADKLTTPTVLSNSPASGALEVAVDSGISVVFSESMNMDTLNATTFTVTQGSPAVAVAGTVTKTGTLAVFTPSTPLANNAVITATVTTGAESEAGVALEAAHTWSFTTIGIAPAALSSTPGDMTTNVAVNAPITVTFSEAMMLSSLLNTFHLTMDADIGIPGTVTYDSATSTATFTPLSALLNNRSFTATISTGAKSSLGVNLVAGRAWSFQTIGVVPAVAFHTPDSIAVNVAVDAPIVVTFDQAMDGTTITDASFSVTGPSVVNGTVTYLNGVATFTPDSALANNTVYTVTLSDTITNAMGIAIPGTSWIFTTMGATPAIVSRVPAPSASNVTVSTGISATFSVAMDGASLTGAFRVTRGNPAVNVPGTVSYSNLVVTFTPTTMPLATNELYTASITEGAMSTLGVHLAGMTAWNFSTMGAVPAVTATDPMNNADFVAIDGTIGVGFSEAMDTASIDSSSFTVTSANPAVTISGSFSFPNPSVAVFTPMASLATYTTYYVNLTQGVQSELNVPLAAAYAFHFKTIGSVPTVSASSPIDNAVFVEVGDSISVTFSEAMDTASIDGASFAVTSGNPAVTVSGSFSFPSASVAVFTPMSSLATYTTFYVKLTPGVKSALNVPLEMTAFRFTTRGSIPTIISTDPIDTADFVDVDGTISVGFSEAMETASIDSSSFTVTSANPAVTVLGSFSFPNASAAVFTPITSLANYTIYYVNLTQGVESALNVPLATEVVFSFTTIGTVPTVSSTSPIDNATFVEIGDSISVTFSEAMDTATITGASFTVTSANPAVTVSGSFSFPSASVAEFTPMSSLATYTTFYVKLTPGVESALNVPLEMTDFRFTTRGSIPAVTSTNPINMAGDVDVDGSISVTFSEAMNTTSITGSSFSVTSANPAVTVLGSFGFPIASVVVFTPMASLATDTTYYVELTQGVESALNVPLAAAYAFSFTTGNPVVLPVNLGTAENFVILAQTAVTAVTNTTYVGGDIGISPGFSDDVTGFSFAETDATQVFFLTSALVKGSVYAADNSAPTPVTVDTAVLDMIDAFDDAAARNANFTDVSLSMVTVPTGVYRFTNSLSVTTDVTLSGSATNVWIFQIAGDVTMASDIRVILTGGAVKENVFWQVDGKVEIGTGAHIEGVVLAAESITLYDSAMAKGRLLSHTWVKLYGNSLVNKVPYWNGLGINLRTAHDFVILGKAGISTVPASVITGDIGVSPAAASFMTGFDPVTIDAGTEFATCSQVIGKMWASNYLLDTPAKMTAAISDMETAYTFADGMTPLQPTELGAGDISGLTLTEGVRYWSSGLLISTDLTLTGSATDVWVFQIDGNLTVASNVKIILSGGALPENVYWQVAGPAAIDVDIGTGVQFNGIILAATEVLIKTGASVNGRVYSQTQVSLQQNVVTQPND